MAEIKPVDLSPLLSYQSTVPAAPVNRPVWVKAVFGVYGLLFLCFISFPIWSSLIFQQSTTALSAAVVAVMTLSGLSLMILPVKTIRRRTIRRRTIWIPVLASGALAGLLATAMTFVWFEYSRGGSGSIAILAVEYGGMTVWLVWSIIFAVIAFVRGPQTIGMKLHRVLIAGSVLELLIAVPTHVVVRQRGNCCAGIFTGTAICIGVLVLFLTLGPSVLLLYWRRGRDIMRPAHPTSEPQTE